MKKVLLVDDSRAIRVAGRRIVESLGLSVLEANDGREALAVCDSNPEIAAILLDWNMPVMNGLEFLQALRAGKHLRQRAPPGDELDQRDGDPDQLDLVGQRRRGGVELQRHL